jgi:nucleotide-binding universal stress UspA family protein
MSFRTILAVVTYAGDVKAHLKSTVELARSQNAHLSVLLVGEAPSLPFYGFGGAGYTRVWVEEGEARADSLKLTRDEVEAYLSSEGISFDVRAHQVIAAREDDLVARHALYADLTVILRSGEGELGTVERQSIDGAVFDSGRPAMFLPKAKEPLDLSSILIAWNSRPEAAEALSNALPFLVAAETVTLLVIDAVLGPKHHGEEPGADMAVLLARHGVAVEVRQVDSGGKPVSEVLRQEAREHGAGLIVMGAYGHSRLRQTILGGTTQEMLEGSECPLFLAH